MYKRQEMTQEQGREILENTAVKMRKIFPNVSPEKFEEDLELIAEVFEDIASCLLYTSHENLL